MSTMGASVAGSATATTTATVTDANATVSNGTGSGSGAGAGVAVVGEVGEPGGKKKKATKRRKVNHACLYCRRSHMTCDDGRPCQRCIKREIGHLCHDEQRPKPDKSQTQQQQQQPSSSSLTQVRPVGETSSGLTSSATAPTTIAPAATTSSTQPASTTLPYLVQPAQPSFYYGAESFGSEFSMLSDFLETLDEATFFSAPAPTVSPSMMFSNYTPLGSSTTTTTTTTATTTTTTTTNAAPSSVLGATTAGTETGTGVNTVNAASSSSTRGLHTLNTHTPNSDPEHEHEHDPTDTIVDVPTPNSSSSSSVLSPSKSPSSKLDLSSSSSEEQEREQQLLQQQRQLPPPLAAPTKTEKFFLTAADQDPGLSRDERLSRVIRSKYEAGLLKPYNYVKGYARLSRWMDVNVSQESKQQILQPLSVLRPKFRAIAQSLKDIDLVFIEEAFERLLLDYDRVFSAMGVPACLWRRTGEIYKGNREFSQLVGVDGWLMREGRLCIYELMAEESAVNYWEKYGNVAFDSTQKAVLTSCVLRFKPALNIPTNGITTTTTSTSATNTSAVVVSSTKQGGYPAPMMSPTTKGGTTGGGGGGGGGGAGGAVGGGGGETNEAGLINCCFSFTIRRDKWGIPSMIVGNFIRC